MSAGSYFRALIALLFLAACAWLGAWLYAALT